MDDERRRRESTYRGHESQNMTGNFISIGGNRELVDDILKQADREKETLLYKVFNTIYVYLYEAYTQRMMCITLKF